MPFELGQPFGPPNEPDFQVDVLRGVLAVLDEPAGPVIRDYPRDAPSTTGEAEPWACALPTPPAAEARDEAEALELRLLAEIGQLRPWYEESIRARGRTAFGLSGRDTAAIPEMAALLAGIASGRVEPAAAIASLGTPLALRFIADDLKAFYFEAAAAQPASRAPTATELNRWLFGETIFGDVLYAARDALQSSPDASAKLPGRFMVPTLYARKPGVA